MKISEPMAVALLRKHATGDFGEHRWPTIRKLFDAGMLAEQHPYIIVTPAGKAWCMEHHGEYAFGAEANG